MKTLKSIYKTFNAILSFFLSYDGGFIFLAIGCISYFFFYYGIYCIIMGILIMIYASMETLNNIHKLLQRFDIKAVITKNKKTKEEDITPKDPLKEEDTFRPNNEDNW